MYYVEYIFHGVHYVEQDLRDLCILFCWIKEDSVSEKKKGAITTYSFNLPISGHICKIYFMISLRSLVTMV